jgi:hypothetical protein
VTCNEPNSAFEEVSDPVTATPSQPITGEKNASAPPTLAIVSPIAVVCAEAFMTYARPSTAATVRIAHRSS